MDKKHDYVTVWGDTVDFRHFLLGISAGAAISFLCSFYGKEFIGRHFAHLAKNLISGYGLMFGMISSIVVAVIVAGIFRPKRIFNQDETHFDKDAFIKEYKIDIEQEAEYLKSVPSEVILEMEQLSLLDMFSVPEK